jgi:hypothetical protein
MGRNLARWAQSKMREDHDMDGLTPTEFSSSKDFASIAPAAV